MTADQPRPWLEINDPHVSPTALVDRVEQRLQERRARLGPVTRRFPSFQALSPVLDPASPGEATFEQRVAALHDVLRQLQELPAPDTHAVLAPSPATRLPVFGRFWALVRSQAHQLVLFYVNRHLAHQTQTNTLISNALHELDALLQAQRQEIDSLQARLDALQAPGEQADG